MKNSKQILYDYALMFIGLPYRWGGDDTIEGFDCSGIAQEILSCVGMDPKGDQTAQALLTYFYNNGFASMSGFGALAFFGKNPDSITHVGFMMNDELMLEAGGGGPNTTSPSAASAHNAYIRIRPVHRRSDLVAIIMPRYSWLT